MADDDADVLRVFVSTDNHVGYVSRGVVFLLREKPHFACCLSGVWRAFSLTYCAGFG